MMFWVETIGVVAGLVCVFFQIRNQIWTWPFNILSTLAYLILFYHVKLYADSILQLFFMTTSIWGWRMWYLSSGKTHHKKGKVEWLSARERTLYGFLTMVAMAVVGFLFSHYTDASLPFWDSAIAGLSITAQILLMRRRVDTWVVWILANTLSVGVYLYKGIYLTALLYYVFLIQSGLGLRSWVGTRSLDK